MGQWAPLRDQEEFADLFRVATPPPLPPRAKPEPVTEFPPVRATSRDTFAPVAEKEEEFSVEPPAREPIFVKSAGSFHPEGNPWVRFVARLTDVNIFVFGLVILLSYTLPLVSPELTVKWVADVDARANYLVALPFAFLLNGILMSIFGNSIGKAIFGLKVVPIVERYHMNIGDYVGRELRVWVQGFALGIPFVNLFTWHSNFREVSAGRPAHYDKSMYHVRQNSGGFRILVGLIVFFAILVGGAAWNVEAEKARSAIRVAQNWTNPITGQVARIPAGFYPEVTNADDGSIIYAFSHLERGVQAFFAAEDALTEFGGLPGYGAAIRTAIGSTIAVGEFGPTFTTGVLKADGNAVGEGWRTSVYVTEYSGDYWRIILLDTKKSGTGGVNEPEILNALLSTID